jgi:hypothetical protein
MLPECQNSSFVLFLDNDTHPLRIDGICLEYQIDDKVMLQVVIPFYGPDPEIDNEIADCSSKDIQQRFQAYSQNGDQSYVQ